MQRTVRGACRIARVAQQSRRRPATQGGTVEASGATTTPTRQFDHLREHSIGLTQVVFQSITHMAPGAAVAYSIYISVPESRQALALPVLLPLLACPRAATPARAP